MAIKVRVLLVEEDPDARLEMRRALQRAQLTSAGEVGYGRSAVGYAAETRPDVVLLGIGEPVEQALETAAQLTQALPETPLIACSALTEPALIRRAMLAGAQDYLFRPVHPAQLMEAVNTVLLREERRRLAQAAGARPSPAAPAPTPPPAETRTGPGGKRAISYQIPAGKRAFTVPVSVTRSPAALIAPGDFVDVIAVMRLKDLGLEPAAEEAGGVLRRRILGDRNAGPGPDDDRWAAVTVLQSLQVLAVQRHYIDSGVPYNPSVRGNPPRDANINFVTLAVTPEQAQVLALTLEQAKALTLALRPFGDLEPKSLTPSVEPIRPEDPALAARP